ncbi:hypothetical protein ACH4E8_26805 [Streptomyces sp. NPDC017979]|uniref:hypothetical protein n=1 Tax=Streptomyces sp. NPDC017979 TaxID=3365024 RepID=UPI0037934781
MERRPLLTLSFATTATNTPLTRWLAPPADDTPPRHRHGHRVGRADVTDLWEAAATARRADSRYGGGNWRTSSVLTCLQQTTPLLRGTYTETVGQKLFRAVAELARVAAWTEVDTGRHGPAQRHFIQALCLARAGDDVQAGAYATASLQQFLLGHTADAVEMAESANEGARHVAAPRTPAGPWSSPADRGTCGPNAWS